ncbi:MAG TPA: permease [Nitrospira sp.]|nr:permease [Nitrospira sp.]
MNRPVDLTFWLLVAAIGLLTAMVLRKDPSLLGVALQHSSRLFAGVRVELVLGFVLAGLIDVLVPQALLMKWLGEQHLAYGILAGWAIGLLLPGGPSLLFPLAANLLRQGAAPGPLIALVTAKILLSPIRLISYEAPLLGWPMTFARFIPSLLLPPVIGVAGQWLFTILRKYP